MELRERVEIEDFISIEGKFSMNLAGSRRLWWGCGELEFGRYEGGCTFMFRDLFKIAKIFRQLTRHTSRQHQFKEATHLVFIWVTKKRVYFEAQRGR